MKKIFLFIVLFICVAVSATAQKTKGDLAREFSNGTFRMEVSADSYVSFSLSPDGYAYKIGDKIYNAAFVTDTSTPEAIKGAQYLISRYEKDKEQFIAVLLDYGIFVCTDIEINEDRTGFKAEMINNLVLNGKI